MDIKSEILKSIFLTIIVYLLSWSFINHCEPNKIILKDITAPKYLKFILIPINGPKSFLGVILYSITIIPGILIVPLSIILYFYNFRVGYKIFSKWFVLSILLFLLFVIVDVLVIIIDSIYKNSKIKRK